MREGMVAQIAVAGLFVVGMLVAAPAAFAAPSKHLLECPATAPADWHMTVGAPLVQAAVLSERAGHPIDDVAPPSLVPDRGRAQGNVWHNVWLMGDEPGWSHFVDCQYRGSTKILRLKADGLKQCEQTARPYNPRTGVSSAAIQTMVCD
jgi:hypothetical protein